ncbi:MAG: protoheme IX farnesyltransferase [Chloroflexi bacterium]|nr:protoheme IX farnesyltransferase [Chloroflexota bacterium]
MARYVADLVAHHDTNSRTRAFRFEILPLLALLKLRIVALLLFVALAAALLAAKESLQAMTVALIVLSGVMSAGGAGALNQYFERDLDALMERTRRRPLVSGRIGNPRIALALGILLIGLSFAITLPVNFWQSLFLLGGALIYVVVYTIWLKRRSAWNVVVGGVAGSGAVLSGWAATADWLAPLPLLIALLLFLWTPPHFWSLAILRSDEYRKAGIPMLPVLSGPVVAARWSLVYAVLVVSTSISLAIVGHFGLLYWYSAALAGALFLAVAGMLALRPDKSMARLSFRVSILYLTVVFAGLILDTWL